ncbi:MAG: hypothetical protein ACOYLF_09365 [Blastocatellia bacterium]
MDFRITRLQVSLLSRDRRVDRQRVARGLLFDDQAQLPWAGRLESCRHLLPRRVPNLQPTIAKEGLPPLPAKARTAAVAVDLDRGELSADLQPDLERSLLPRPPQALADRVAVLQPLGPVLVPLLQIPIPVVADPSPTGPDPRRPCRYQSTLSTNAIALQLQAPVPVSARGPDDSATPVEGYAQPAPCVLRLPALGSVWCLPDGVLPLLVRRQDPLPVRPRHPCGQLRLRCGPGWLGGNRWRMHRHTLPPAGQERDEEHNGKEELLDGSCHLVWILAKKLF